MLEYLALQTMQSCLFLLKESTRQFSKNTEI